MDSHDNLKKKLEKSQTEEFERGKDLEKLTNMLNSWEHQLPEEFKKICQKVLEGYQKRCTAKSSYHQKRLKKSENSDILGLTAESEVS